MRVDRVTEAYLEDALKQAVAAGDRREAGALRRALDVYRVTVLEIHPAEAFRRSAEAASSPPEDESLSLTCRAEDRLEKPDRT